MILTDHHPERSDIWKTGVTDSLMGRKALHQQPQVSVVLIFLDEALYLQEAVDSVLSQTCDRWELLLVDDGSTDGSTDIAKVAEWRLPHKVRYLEHERHVNRGMSASRNLGLKYAKGEYVLFLDGDDVLTPEALREQVALLEDHPEVGMVYGPMHHWFGWNGDSDEQRRDYIQKLDHESDIEIEGPTVLAAFIRNESATPSGNLFRTALVRAVGGFEDKFRGMYEDQVFRVKFCLRFLAYASSRVWYKYRKHPDSTCAQAVKLNQAYDARGRFLQWAEDFCRHHDVRDARIWIALREALHPYRYPRLARLKKQMVRYKTRVVWRIIEVISPVARRLLPKATREWIWSYLNRMKSLLAPSGGVKQRVPAVQDQIAVRVERLSKQYTITVRPGSSQTLSERLHGAFTNIWRSPTETRREAIWSLQDASFEIMRGEVVGIIGRNGAGKSTLLKILSRVTEPTSGRVEIFGRVGTLLEVGTGFHPELSGRDNVYLSGIILGMRKQEIDEKFDEIVAFSGIGKYLDTPVKRYSSGMYVRLAFAVAAHLESEVLIVDEVLSVGDGEFQKKCLSKIQEMGKQGRTVLVVSHDLPTITRLCHRVILLDKGCLIADGPTGEVVSKYLHGGIHASSAREWPDRASAPGNDAVRIRAVRIHNDQRATTNVIDISRPFSVELEYEVLQSGLILAPHFGLFNEKGDLLFLSYEVNIAWRDCSRKIGKYVSRGIVPGDLLTEGTYFVSAFCRTLQTREVDIEEHEAVMFQVVESKQGNSARGNIGGHIPGLIRPLLEWSTHFEELTEPIVPCELINK